MTPGLYQWSPRKPKGKGWVLVLIEVAPFWTNRLWFKADG